MSKEMKKLAWYLYLFAMEFTKEYQMIDVSTPIILTILDSDIALYKTSMLINVYKSF